MRLDFRSDRLCLHFGGENYEFLGTSAFPQGTRTARRGSARRRGSAGRTVQRTSGKRRGHDPLFCPLPHALPHGKGPFCDEYCGGQRDHHHILSELSRARHRIVLRPYPVRFAGHYGRCGRCVSDAPSPCADRKDRLCHPHRLGRLPHAFVAAPWRLQSPLRLHPASFFLPHRTLYRKCIVQSFSAPFSALCPTPFRIGGCTGKRSAQSFSAPFPALRPSLFPHLLKKSGGIR